jgi:hypothetical protein
MGTLHPRYDETLKTFEAGEAAGPSEPQLGPERR